MHDKAVIGQAIGRLELDSPGLYSTFSKLFNPAELAELEGVYQFAASFGALDEPPICREQGASYNSKPARICTILIQELKEQHLVLFKSAICSCCKDLSELSVKYPLETKAALAVQKGLSGPPVLDLPEPTQRIFLAIVLDEIRHLHMTSLSQAERLKRIESLKTTLGSMSILPAHNAFKAKIDYAMERFLRRF